MIKKIISLALCVYTSTAIAQNASPFIVNVGCFTNNFDSCGNCTAVDIACSFNDNTDLLNFGYSVARLCNLYGNALLDSDTLEKRANANATIANNNLAAFNSCKVEKDNCNATLTATSASNLSNILALSNQKQLVSKLRKACGSKCKKIK